MKRYFILFLPLLFLFLAGCESPKPMPVADFSPSAVDTTEDDIRQQKPKFLDFIPVKYHLVNTGDYNYIRIVTNSDDLQKVWMVYYDNKLKKWDTLTWIGRGKNSTIIADTTFKTIYGVVYPSGPIDDPTFYMAYSKDEGKTWQNHPIEKSILDCKKKGPQIDHTAQLLLSSDFPDRDGKPSIVMILQSAVANKMESSKATGQWDNSYLCPLMREVVIKP